MKSARHLDELPAGVPLLADDLTEFHAARLLLLLNGCGQKGRIEGLTKLAKLDFFVRYPAFFARACAARGKVIAGPTDTVESPMVRYRYGPWDHRYYQVLSYLESRDLIQILKQGNAFHFQLTPQGVNVSKKLSKNPEFGELVIQIREVKHAFGTWKGSTLKALIYEVFDKEVAERTLGEVIHQ